jgi:hypothetical protein
MKKVGKDTKIQEIEKSRKKGWFSLGFGRG